MGTEINLRWQPSYAAQSDRRPCEYQAYLPDLLQGRPFSIDGDSAADIAEAEQAIARLNSEASALADSEALARLLLRAEAVASSRLEGLQLGARRLLRAEFAAEAGATPEVTAAEILRNIQAMDWAIRQAACPEPITVAQLLEAHRLLMAGGHLAASAGQIRSEQNWIGGNRFNPCGAAFVPPPPQHVAELLDDLVQFCNSDHLSPLTQAAIAHAQFETIHPFVDGNGRVGRVLIHVILRRRGLARCVTPPVSLTLATWSGAYVGGLATTRYMGDSHGEEPRAGVNQWLHLFAAASLRAAQDASRYEQEIAALTRGWSARLGPVRQGSATQLLLMALPRAPMFTVVTASALIGRTFQATNEAVARLEAAGIINSVSVGKRNRAFEVPDIVDIFTDLERRLASPEGETRIAPPARPTSQRRAPQSEPPA